MEPSVMILLILLGFVGILWFAKVIFRFREFRSQLKDINRELERCSERSRPFWKKRRRRLWWSYLLRPF